MNTIGGDRRLVVLTGSGPEHIYVANRLCQQFSVEAIIVDVGTKRTFRRRLRRYSCGTMVSKLLRRAYLKGTCDERTRLRALNKVLEREMSGEFHRHEIVRSVHGINNLNSVQIIKETRPSAILVYGTALVSDSTLGLATDIALNMHTGISPYYRGADCAFWPIHNRQPEMLGATVHECTSAIDGGRIFRTGRAEIAPDDGLHEAFARSVICGANLYVEVVGEYLLSRLHGKPQNLAAGTEYRAAMRTFAAEWRARRFIRNGLLRHYAQMPRSDLPAKS